MDRNLQAVFGWYLAGDGDTQTWARSSLQALYVPERALVLGGSHQAVGHGKWIFATKGTKSTEDCQFTLSPFVTFVPLVANSVTADLKGDEPSAGEAGRKALVDAVLKAAY